MGDKYERETPETDDEWSGFQSVAEQRRLERADAPGPDEPAVCLKCGLAQDRYPTSYGAWIFLEPKEWLAAHIVPPRQRWKIIGAEDGDTAWNTWDAEPLPRDRCRIPHHLVCPFEDADFLPWLTATRELNRERAQRLFEIPDEGEAPDVAG